MSKIIVCQGIQGSGKTTFAKQWVNKDPEHRVRINRDDIRNMLGKYWVPSRERLVSLIEDATINNALNLGYDVVIDNMNLNKGTLEHLNLLSSLFSNIDVEYKPFKTPLKECIKRDSLRENPIGEEIIRKTYEKYKDFYKD